MIIFLVYLMIIKLNIIKIKKKLILILNLLNLFNLKQLNFIFRIIKLNNKIINKNNICYTKKSNYKIYKQKGLGKARRGNIKSINLIKGFNKFGPKKNLFFLKVNYKEKLFCYQIIILNKRSNIIYNIFYFFKFFLKLIYFNKLNMFIKLTIINFLNYKINYNIILFNFINIFNIKIYYLIISDIILFTILA